MTTITKFKQTEIGMIPEDWEIKTVKDVTLRVTKGTTPTTLKRKFTDTGINFIKVESITEAGDFIPSKFAHIDEETNEILKRSILEENDVLFSIAGAIGRTAIVTKNILPANTNQAIAIIRPNTAMIKPNFLRYTVGNKDFIQRIKGNIVQTAQPNLSLGLLSDGEIGYPNTDEQSAIAKILSDLDSKIELNKQMNKTLEEIGQVIFKRWFVDFEFPNENGEPYKSSGGEMVDSEIGEVPKGCQASALGTVLKVIKGCSYRSEDLKESDKALVTLKSINRGGGFNQEGYKEYTGNYREEQVVKDGDIVVAQTDITQNAEVIGTPAIINSLNKYDKLIASLDLQILRIKDKLSYNFLYYLLKTDTFHNHALSYTNGTTVLHLNKNAVPYFEFIVPKEDILKRFSQITSKLIEKMKKNEKENFILIQIRDSLLPKLMSGKIRVPIEVRI